MTGPSTPSPPRHVHLIEPGPLGHGPLWLGYLLDALLPGVERVTVTHPDLPAYEPLTDRHRAAGDRLTLRPVPWHSDKRSWRNTLRGARLLGADLSLITFVDELVKKYPGDLSRQLNSPVWGIWYLPAERRPVSRWDPRRLYSGQARGRFREQRAVRRVPGWLSGVFLLDELLAARLTPRPGLAIEVLPDPWPTRPTMAQAEARRRLDLPADRRIFLHFGVANPRKGLRDTILCWQRLQDEPDAVLLRAGLTGPEDAAALRPLTSTGRAILHNRRVPETEVDWYFRACDWVLLPYRGHEGSSGLLSAAAASRRPVIAADHGVIGERTRRAGLGVLFAHGDVEALAAAVRGADRPDARRYEAALAAYAETHDLAGFLDRLRSALGLQPPRQEPCFRNQS